MRERRPTFLAFLAALSLHALLLAVTWHTNPFASDSKPAVPRPRDETVEVTLDPEPATAFLPVVKLPTAYTSVPERQQAESPPENPDFLALRNSLAADLIPGGDPGSSPGAARVGEFPQVAIVPGGGGGGSEPAIASAPAAPEGGSGQAEGDRDAEGERERLGRELPQAPGGTTASGGDADLTQHARRGEGGQPAAPGLVQVPEAAPVSILDDLVRQPGDLGFDYRQEEFSPAGGNQIRFGDFQLSTVEWDFAPWLETFKRDFLPNWIPPYAYHLGVIDGWTVVELVIQPDGAVSAMVVVEKQGHESLHQASVAALRATAPLQPLPGHFPDPELVLTVKLHYSAQEELPPAGPRR